MSKREQYNHSIADNIRRLRIERGLSQEQVTAKLQTLGIDYTPARISQVELKKRPPAAVLIVALKYIFDCEYHEFFSEIETDYNAILKNK